jgi:hypothetical protein
MSGGGGGVRQGGRIVVYTEDVPFPETPEQFRCLFQITQLEDRSGQPPNATNMTSHTQIIICGGTYDALTGMALFHGKLNSTDHPRHRVSLTDHKNGLLLALVCTNRNGDVRNSVLWKTEMDSASLNTLVTIGSKDNILSVDGTSPHLPCPPHLAQAPRFLAELTLGKGSNRNKYITQVDVYLSLEAFNDFLEYAKY